MTWGSLEGCLDVAIIAKGKDEYLAYMNNISCEIGRKLMLLAVISCTALITTTSNNYYQRENGSSMSLINVYINITKSYVRKENTKS